MSSTWVKIIAAALVIVNLAAFFLMGYDKHCAKKGKWRVPEATLFAVTACFGGVGGTAGMFAFHHKTQHWYFRIFFPALAIIQIAVLVYLGIKLL